MKTSKSYISFLLILTSFFSWQTTKAQSEDCPVCGWYVDGVKVDSIDCYSFDKLTLVLPYDNDLTTYNQLTMVVAEDLRKQPVGMFAESKVSEAEIDVSGKSIKTFLKGGYIVYTLFSKADGDDGKNHAPQMALSRYNLVYDTKKMGRKQGDLGREAVFTGGLVSGTITSYTTTYEESCHCTETKPVYSYKSASKEYKLILKKRIVDNFMATGKVDLTAACSFPGKKVDVNNLGSSAPTSNNNSSTTNTTSNNSTNNTSSKTTTSKSVAGPYSEKYDNGKIKVQGQKNANGEQEGAWKYFDENGKLERIENYVKGIAEGEWKYYEEGKLTKTEIYKGGEVISTKEVED